VRGEAKGSHTSLFQNQTEKGKKKYWKRKKTQHKQPSGASQREGNGAGRGGQTGKPTLVNSRRRRRRRPRLAGSGRRRS